MPEQETLKIRDSTPAQPAASAIEKDGIELAKGTRLLKQSRGYSLIDLHAQRPGVMANLSHSDARTK